MKIILPAKRIDPLPCLVFTDSVVTSIDPLATGEGGDFEFVAEGVLGEEEGFVAVAGFEQDQTVYQSFPGKRSFQERKFHNDDAQINKPTAIAIHGLTFIAISTNSFGTPTLSQRL